MEHLFVYGTLIPGRENDFVLKNIKGIWQKATVKGFFDAKGWGKSEGFPSVILAENGNVIDGYLFSSEELIENWDRIDEFESDLYQRVKTTIFLENQSKILGYIYELNSSLTYDIQLKKR
ncbi:gamma-glutamylcyclotransferase family protein [Polaribacter sp. BAL334]|uniref:gamma-glutamylcyclotransferase family protein n=1 Tax=Polaribacter sp. BAL334 TaxID=1708178 RepID=UPI0018D24F2E|nr:gamma-glutamylcyclotransferase family protein [Polaribacter sp. BAL334]